MKRRYPLDVLIQARSVRVDTARREVEIVRAQLRSAELERDRCAAFRDAKQNEFDLQRRLLIDPVQERDEQDAFAQREHFIELLSDQLQAATDALTQARDQVRSTMEELETAIQRMHRLQAKLDSLVERKKQWRLAQERAGELREELDAEQVFLSQRVNKSRRSGDTTDKSVSAATSLS
jgi:DNA repair ATPase RecN